jgi:hypothetical protein
VHALRSFFVYLAVRKAAHVAELRVEDDLEVELRWVLKNVLDGCEHLLERGRTVRGRYIDVVQL